MREQVNVIIEGEDKEQLLPSLWKYQAGLVNTILLVQRPCKVGVQEQER